MSLKMAKVNDIVQLSLDHKWAGALVCVEQVRSWGIQGFIYVPTEGKAYIRVNHDEYYIIGEAAILIGEEQ